MASRDTASLLNRLCHAVVLSRDSTVRTAAGNLIINMLSSHHKVSFRAAADVVDAAEEHFGVHLSPALVQDAIGDLQAAGSLLTDAGGTLVLSAHARTDVRARLVDALELERDVRQEWWADLARDHPDWTDQHRGELWRGLQSYLGRAFLQHGAETAQLLDPTLPTDPATSRQLAGYLEDSIRAECHLCGEEEAASALRLFFIDPSAHRARYLAQLLDATFALFALGMDEATAAYLRESLPPLTIFLDTNFLFGLIGLADEPQPRSSAMSAASTLVRASSF